MKHVSSHVNNQSKSSTCHFTWNDTTTNQIADVNNQSNCAHLLGTWYSGPVWWFLQVVRFGALILNIVPHNVFEINFFEVKFEINFELTSLKIFEIILRWNLPFSKFPYWKWPSSINYWNQIMTWCFKLKMLQKYPPINWALLIFSTFISQHVSTLNRVLFR